MQWHGMPLSPGLFCFLPVSRDANSPSLRSNSASGDFKTCLQIHQTWPRPPAQTSPRKLPQVPSSPPQPASAPRREAHSLQEADPPAPGKVFPSQATPEAPPQHTERGWNMEQVRSECTQSPGHCEFQYSPPRVGPPKHTHSLCKRFYGMPSTSISLHPMGNGAPFPFLLSTVA